MWIETGRGVPDHQMNWMIRVLGFGSIPGGGWEFFS